MAINNTGDDNSYIIDQTIWDSMWKTRMMPLDMTHPQPTIEPRHIIDDAYYSKLLVKIQLLQSMSKLENSEVARLIGMIDSQDPENWTMAEECIKQKFSEL